MTKPLLRLAGVTFAGALAVAAPVRAAETNAIRAIDVAEREGAVELSIRGSRPPSYSTFKLQDPARLVVDPWAGLRQAKSARTPGKPPRGGER